MPKFALKDAAIYINGIDQSNYVHHLAVEAEKEEIDITPLGAQPYSEHYPGIESLVFSFDMFWGNRTVDETLRNAQRDGNSVMLRVGPRNDLASPSNPMWEADCFITDFTPFAGDVGKASMSQITLKATGAYEIASAEALLPFFPSWAVTVLE